MDTQTVLSLIFYGVLFTLCFTNSLTVQLLNSENIENKLFKAIAVMVILILIGIFFCLLGDIFNLIGKFLLAPIFYCFK